MTDELKNNLEPIEESDLNLKEKFLGSSGAVGTEKEAEVPHTLEQKGERQEGVQEKEASYSKILSKVKSSSESKDEDISKDAEDANKELEYGSKINKLVELAELKGVVHAVKVARHMEDNYLLDELHDKLLGDDLHEALVKKGFINED